MWHAPLVSTVCWEFPGRDSIPPEFQGCHTSVFSTFDGFLCFLIPSSPPFISKEYLRKLIFYLLSDLCNYVNWSCFKLLIVVTHVTPTVTKRIWVWCLCYAVTISVCSRLYFIDQLRHPLKVTINQKGRMNTTTDALHHLQSLKTKRRQIHPQKCKYVHFRWSVCIDWLEIRCKITVCVCVWIFTLKFPVQE